MKRMDKALELIKDDTELSNVIRGCNIELTRDNIIEFMCPGEFGLDEYQHSCDSDIECMNCWNEEVKKENEEMVNHPIHYNQGIEAIDYIESHKLSFCLGNVVKYITRAKHKGTELQDLKKASWYLQREIDRLEKGE